MAVEDVNVGAEDTEKGLDGKAAESKTEKETRKGSCFPKLSVVLKWSVVILISFVVGFTAAYFATINLHPRCVKYNITIPTNETVPKNNETGRFFLDFQKETTGIGSAFVLYGSTSLQPYKNNESPSLEREVTGIGSPSVKSDENPKVLLDFEKRVVGVGASSIHPSHDKAKLVDLNIEKKINGIGFVNTKESSSDTNLKDNNYFLDFQKETTGIGSAYVRPESTSLQPYKNNESPDIERVVTGIGFSTGPVNTNSVPDFQREVTGIGFSTEPENAKSVPDLQRETTGIASSSTVTSDENKKILFIEKKFDGIASSKIDDSVNDAKPLKLSVNKEVKGIGLSNIKESPATIGPHNS